MNAIDLVILVPILWGAWRGFSKGLIIEIFMLLALLAGVYGGVHLSESTGDLLLSIFDIKKKYVPLVAFTIIFLIVGAMVYFLGKLVEKFIDMIAMKMVNKLLGAFLGILKTVFIVGVAIVLYDSYDKNHSFLKKETKEKSALYYPFRSMTISLVPVLKDEGILQETSKLEELKNSILNQKEE